MTEIADDTGKVSASAGATLRVTGLKGNPLRVVISSGDEATIDQKLIDSFASPSPLDPLRDEVARLPRASEHGFIGSREQLANALYECGDRGGATVSAICKTAADMIPALEAEKARLRVALVKISDMKLSLISNVRTIAAEALSQLPKT